MSENTETFNVLGGQSSTATDSTTDKINITNNYTKRATVNNPVFTTAEENKDEHDASISYNKIYDGSHNSTSNISAFELKMVVDEALSGNKEALPDMWSYDYIGLYCQYAAVGLLYGSAGTVIPFCVYTFDGPSNVCSNGKNVMFFAWSLKIFIAVLTDMYRPFGFRRRPWMMFGWAGTLLCLLILATTANLLPLSLWLTLLMFSQFFLMFSDVPADGYSVELGHMEPLESRGQILATGQRIRFSFSVLAGVLQTFLLNGPATSEDDCDVTFNGCWAWGLTINGYYGLLFAIVFVLTLPVWWLKEIDCTNIPQHNFDHFKTKIWETMQNLTTYYLIVFVIGIQALTGFTSKYSLTVSIDCSYCNYITAISLSNFKRKLIVFHR